MSDPTTFNALDEEASAIAEASSPGLTSERLARLCRLLVARVAAIYERLRSTEDSVNARLRALETSHELHGKSIKVIRDAIEPIVDRISAGQHDARIDALEVGLKNLRQDYTSAWIKNVAPALGDDRHEVDARLEALVAGLRAANDSIRYAGERIYDARERIHEIGRRVETLETGLTAARTDIRQAAAAGLFSRPADPAVFESRMAGLEDALKASSGEVVANIAYQTERVLSALADKPADDGGPDHVLDGWGVDGGEGARFRAFLILGDGRKWARSFKRQEERDAFDQAAEAFFYSWHQDDDIDTSDPTR